jgi:hypothetical protein
VAAEGACRNLYRRYLRFIERYCRYRAYGNNLYPRYAPATIRQFRYLGMARERLAKTEETSTHTVGGRLFDLSPALMPLSYLPDACENHGNDESPTILLEYFHQPQRPHWCAACPFLDGEHETNSQNYTEADDYGQGDSNL